MKFNYRIVLLDLRLGNTLRSTRPRSTTGIRVWPTTAVEDFPAVYRLGKQVDYQSQRGETTIVLSITMVLVSLTGGFLFQMADTKLVVLDRNNK